MSENASDIGAEVIASIFFAVDDVNKKLPRNEQIEKSKNTILMGASGNLDSLELANLIVSIEQKIEENFGVPLMLLGDAALLENQISFESIGKLAEHITQILKKKING